MNGSLGLTAILNSMICPTCAGALKDESRRFVCENGHGWRSDRGYVDLSLAPLDSSTAATFESFGYEWQSFSRAHEEDEIYWREYFSNVNLSQLADSIALDAGCGMGRYSQFTASHVGTLVALDGSDAVVAAARNLAVHENVLVLKADLRHAPFRDATFDFVQCLGVLHHLSDPMEGFSSLVRVLKPGGQMLLYLYSTPMNRGVRSVALAAATKLRTLTVRMPHPLLRAVSAPLALALYTLFVLPGTAGEALGSRRMASLPLNIYRGKPVRSLWLDTFDRLSAPLEFRYRLEDVRPWFESHGLVIDAVDERFGLTILSTKREAPLEPF